MVGGPAGEGSTLTAEPRAARWGRAAPPLLCERLVLCSPRCGGGQRALPAFPRRDRGPCSLPSKSCQLGETSPVPGVRPVRFCFFVVVCHLICLQSLQKHQKLQHLLYEYTCIPTTAK